MKWLDEIFLVVAVAVAGLGWTATSANDEAAAYKKELEKFAGQREPSQTPSSQKGALSRNEVIAGGPQDFMEVRHLVLKGSNREIGRALAAVGWERHHLKPATSSDRGSGSARTAATTRLANPSLTVPWQVADTGGSVRQGTTDPRQGNNPTCFDPRLRASHLLSACISGSQALMKGGRHDRIEASCSSLPGIPP